VRIVAIGCALALAAVPASAAPCHGCTFDAPSHATDPVPLVVVLHGDREHAPAAAARWKKAVLARGWALLALECPSPIDSWWQWGGDASWVTDQIAALDQTVAIDHSRMFLIGWSGGASYIGERASLWTSAFAAVVLHGGGVPPFDASCPSRALPAYFLVGDRNPLHKWAVALRDYFVDCKQDVTWDLVSGGDHGKEEAALNRKKADAILDWLAARPVSKLQ
jgi:poly(3-hydroxybutyrate) depolymerase